MAGAVGGVCNSVFFGGLPLLFLTATASPGGFTDVWTPPDSAIGAASVEAASMSITGCSNNGLFLGRPRGFPAEGLGCMTIRAAGCGNNRHTCTVEPLDKGHP